VAAEAAVYDLAGRRLRTLHLGPLARGLTTLSWDGRDERGGALAAGVYLLRLSAEGRSAVARIVRR
jgi:flagellar hook assembly protein FlgD